MEKQTKMDIISNLPWDVLHTILVHLPLRDAARTSILSRKWRYKWTGLSQFVFDDKCLCSFVSDKARWGEIMQIIHHIQLNQTGPIEKFKLAAYCCPDHSDLDQLIHFLTKKGIKELIIQEFIFAKRYKLPSCLFSCLQLSHLELYGCIFKLPSAFQGFNHLKSLQFTQVSIHDYVLESLVLNCPVLERLTLLKVDHLAFLKIHNPNLTYLKVDSKFEDVCLENCPLLANVDIRMIPMYDGVILQHLEQQKGCNLVKVFGCLRGIKRLTLSSYFLQYLGKNDVPARLPIMLDHLLALDLKEVNFDNLKEVKVAFSILKSSPNLNEVLVSVGHSNLTSSSSSCKPVLDFLKTQHLSDFFFNQLKVVRIRGACATRPAWDFVKFILAHSPALETMIIVKYRGERIPDLMLRQVERASEHVTFTSLSL